MKKLIVVLAVIAMISIAVSSCENSVTQGGYFTASLEIPVWNYSESHYFVDTLYRRSFTEFYKDSITNFVIENTLYTQYYTEVWVQCDVNTQNKRLCVGKVMLGPRPPQGYDTSITKPEIVVDNKYFGYFRKLNENEYYINPQAGFVGLKIDVPVNYHVGVVYRNVRNQIFGFGELGSQINDTLILKLIKVDSPDPTTTPLAWKLKMKNVYRGTAFYILSSSFISLGFRDFNNPNNYNNYIDSIPGYSAKLITMLKLDRYNNGTMIPPPDGKFDWIENKIVYPQSADIIFPMLEPFLQGIQSNGLDSSYTYSEIYNSPKTVSQISPKANYYRIGGYINYSPH